MRSRNTSKPTAAPLTSSARSTRGCSSPNCASTVGPSRSTPERPGMVPGGRIGRDLQVVDRRAAAREQRRRIGLGVERIDGARLRRPVARAPAPMRTPAATSTWPSGVSSPYCGPTSNSATSAKPRSALRARRLQQVRQHRRPHHVEIGADRVGERHRRPVAAEQLGDARRRHEGEGHRLDQAARGQRALRDRHAPLRRRDRRPPAAPSSRGSGTAGIAVEAVDAQHLLDEIGLALDVAAPGRRRRQRSTPSFALDGEAERLQDALRLGRRHVEAAQALDAVGPQREAAVASRGSSPALTTSLASPPQSSRIRRVATSAPHTRDSADRGRARSGSARRTRCRACGRSRRCAIGSNSATSRKTSVVVVGAAG